MASAKDRARSYLGGHPLVLRPCVHESSNETLASIEQATTLGVVRLNAILDDIDEANKKALEKSKRKGR